MASSGHSRLAVLWEDVRTVLGHLQTMDTALSHQQDDRLHRSLRPELDHLAQQTQEAFSFLLDTMRGVTPGTPPELLGALKTLWAAYGRLHANREGSDHEIHEVLRLFAFVHGAQGVAETLDRMMGTRDDGQLLPGTPAH